MSDRRAEAKRLSLALEQMLVGAQRRARALPGHVKCPVCGASVEKTKNGRIRVHRDSPVSMDRCPASGKSLKRVRAELKR